MLGCSASADSDQPENPSAALEPDPDNSEPLPVCAAARSGRRRRGLRWLGRRKRWATGNLGPLKAHRSWREVGEHVGAMEAIEGCCEGRERKCSECECVSVIEVKWRQNGGMFSLLARTLSLFNFLELSLGLGCVWIGIKKNGGMKSNYYVLLFKFVKKSLITMQL